MISVALVIGLPLVLGWSALRALDVRAGDDRCAFLAWCWLAGSLVVAALEALCLACAWPLERAWLDSGIALAVATGIAIARRSSRRAASASGATPRSALGIAGDVCAIFVLLFLALHLAAQFRLASSVPVMVGDEASIWSSRAKALYGAGDFGARYARFVDAPLDVYHADYPLLDPLLQLFVFVQAGSVELALQRLPLQITSIALLLAFAAAVRRAHSGWIAALSTFALAGIPGFALHAKTAEADLCVAFGILVALDAWLRFEATREARWIRLCALGLGFAVAAKHEGALLAASFATAVSCAAVFRAGAAVELLRRRLRTALWFLLPVALFGATWALNRAHGIGNDLLSENAEGRSFVALIAEHGAERAMIVARTLAVELCSPNGAGGAILPLGLALGLLAGRRALRPPLLVPLLALAFAWIGYAAVYLGTPHDVEWHLATSLERIAFHLLPSCALLAMEWLALAAPRSRESTAPARSFAGAAGGGASGST